MDKQTSCAITIMRVIGMMYVAIGNHYLPRYYPGAVTTGISQFFGFLGVGMFFAVSGYLFGIQSRNNSYVGSGRWLIKRLKRIMIPYWLILIIVIMVRCFQNQTVSALSILVSAINLQGITQLQYAFSELGHTWFISIIMVSYFLTCFWCRYKDSKIFWNLHWVVYVAVIILFAVTGKYTSASYSTSILLFSVMYIMGYKQSEIGGGYSISGTPVCDHSCCYVRNSHTDVVFC